MISSIITKFVAKQMARSKGVIANKKAVEFSSAAMEDRLMRNGFDPNAIKSESELLAILNSIKQKENLAFQREFKDIFTRKNADVFDLQGKKIDPNQPIIGGTQQVENTTGSLTSVPKKEGLAGMEYQTKADMADARLINDMYRTTGPRSLDEDKMYLAEFIAEEAGKVLDDLPVSEQKVFIDRAEKALIKNVEKYKKVETDAEILARIKKENKEAAEKLREKRIKEKMDDMKEIEDPEDMATGGRAGFKSGSYLFEGLKDLGKKYRGSTLEAILENPKILGTELGYEGLAEILRMGGMMQAGGRVGLKDGMDRRTFLKIMGGLASVPILGKFFKLGKVAGGTKVASDVASTVSKSTPPPYFFELANKIKTLGKPDKVTYADRVEIHRYTGKNGDEYELVEDLSTGDMKITKDKPGMASSGEETYDVINDRSVMEYKKGDVNVDPDKKISSKAPDEYDEYKVQFDVDGTEADADDMSAFIRKEIIEETTSEAPKIKKAAGGVAYMLGE